MIRILAITFARSEILPWSQTGLPALLFIAAFKRLLHSSCSSPSPRRCPDRNSRCTAFATTRFIGYRQHNHDLAAFALTLAQVTIASRKTLHFEATAQQGNPFPHSRE